MSLPNFIIAGSPRCGTTSLYYYLKQHPLLFMSDVKEVDFFNLDYRYEKGLKWYSSFFEGAQEDKIIGEASPNYMHVLSVPERIKTVLPDVKLIFLLRDPVKRAYSHYLQKYFYGIEKHSFYKALKIESDRIGKDVVSFFDYSYKYKSVYIKHLRNFNKYFNRNQMLILFSEDFYTNPINELNKILKFLGVNNNFEYTLVQKSSQNSSRYPRIPLLMQILNKDPLYDLIIQKKISSKGILKTIIKVDTKIHGIICKHNIKDAPKMGANVKGYLENYFRPFNKELEEFLGAKTPWKY